MSELVSQSKQTYSVNSLQTYLEMIDLPMLSESARETAGCSSYIGGAPAGDQDVP